MRGFDGKDKNAIRCRYCHYNFVPAPVVTRNGKKRSTYVECPRCGNGMERPYRWYDGKGATVSG